MSEPRVLTRRLLVPPLAVAAKVNGWIDGCAAAGYKAIEPDNYDSYTRSENLAIGQKNTVELAGARQSVGLDFAVAEECGQYDECGEYVDAFSNNVIVIEYTDSGRQKTCGEFGSTLTIVQRDVDVSVSGTAGYVRKTC